MFSFREAARSKPQIFKVVRQEWPFEALSGRALVSRLKTAFSFYGAVFRSHGISLFVYYVWNQGLYKVGAGKPSSSCSVPDSSGFMYSMSWDFVENVIVGFFYFLQGIWTVSKYLVPYRIKIYRKKERNSDFSHSSMPSIHSGELTLPLLWKVGAQTPDLSPS